ncbi:MAG: response regulator transcription factor [Acidobacteria bacterium]|nr:response regulator transcription factor [Acidobacteriota bacterium]
MSTRVLIVEDDRAIARLLRDNLEYEGFSVEWAANGQEALEKAHTHAPELVLLDLMLPPGVDGYELCRTFSDTQGRAVIIITARGQKEERIRGLQLGADDYIVKPFALDELLARVNAVLRRTSPRPDVLRLGDVEIDFRRLRATRGHRELSLTDREFEILRYLAGREGRMVTRTELLQLVWGYKEAPVTRAVDSFIFRLRRKIEADPHHPRYIRTAHGDGYRLTPDDE